MHGVHFRFVAFIALIVLIVSCSGTGMHWARLDRFQKHQLELLNKNIDPKSKMAIAQAVIDSLQLFMQECHDSTYGSKANGSVAMWKQRKAIVERDFLNRGELHLIDTAEAVGAVRTP